MSIYIDGIEVPYTKVAYEYSRNPSPTQLVTAELSQSNILVHKLNRYPEVFEVPVIYTRRGNEDLSWDDIKDEIVRICYKDVESSINIMEGADYQYKGYITSVNFDEEHEYAGRGSLQITPTVSGRFGKEETLSITSQSTHVIGGHTSTTWKTKTTFSDSANSYTFKFNRIGKTALRDITQVVINYNFIKGDILEIDYRRRRVNLNGNDITNTVSILNSSFKELPIGEVEFFATHKTDVIYNERYY